MRFTDTAGFIRKLPHDFVASFRATMEEAAEADVLLHVVGVSHPAWEEQMQVVGDALPTSAFEGSGRRTEVVLNKADLLDHVDLEFRLRQAQSHGFAAALVSASTGLGLEGYVVVIAS